MPLIQPLVALVESGHLPDWLIRSGIQFLLRQRIGDLPLGDSEKARTYLADFVQSMSDSPVALLAEKANEQHYEVPAKFFEQVLGKRRKYSSCLWGDAIGSLDEAEISALETTCQHAGLGDGMDILELGCGWGSLSLWMAEKYPNSLIVGVSNSHSQRESIMERARLAGFANLEIITCDMNTFAADRQFDRVVSVEMFEHMRNWQILFNRVDSWLKPGGMFLMHVFCHKTLPYLFDVEDESDWMSQYFFSGGMMPSWDLPTLVSSRLELVNRWRWSGLNYEKTANAWLANMDKAKDELWPVMTATYGEPQAHLWWVRWRIFFMACAELWGYRNGEEWHVGHYLFASRN